MKYSREEVLRAMKVCANDDFEQCVAQECPYLGGDADGNVCIHDLIADVAEVMEHSEPIIHAEWRYYVNDENRPRWRCSNCRKLCRRNPHDKKRCSTCGAHMKMEGDR